MQGVIIAFDVGRMAERREIFLRHEIYIDPLKVSI